MTGQLALAANPLWYAGRAGGTIALILLTATVVLGITVAGQAAIGRFELGRLHRDLAMLSLAFLTLHVVTVIADTFTHLSWTVAFVPFAASYRPLRASGGAVPFLGLLGGSSAARVWLMVLVTLVGLAVAGVLAARAAGTPALRPTLRVVIGGGLAMAVTAAVGQIAQVSGV